MCTRKVNGLLAWVAIVLCAPSLLFAQGVILQGAGPINRSMGGASVAAPIDAMGAIYWNPASISGMERSEAVMSLDFLGPSHTISSTIGGVTGETKADAGYFPIPNVAVVHKTWNERLTLGAGVNTIAGFGTNIPVDPTNPLLNPVPAGLGQISSSALFLQMSPVVSYAIADNLSIGFGPTLTTGRLSVEPFVLDSANLNGTYSAGNATHYHWGAGFQLGTYYIVNESWRLGASFKSPTWMETFEFNGTDENGLPRTLELDIDLPSMLSLGTSFTLTEKTLFALDCRFLDYKGTNGLGGTPAFDATGKLSGLGHRSVFSTAFGVQRYLSDYLTFRAGYCFNQNPIGNNDSMYNIASPVIYQHMIAFGASINLSDSFSFDAGYSYYFENDRSGPVVLPGVGTIPGSSVRNTMDAHAISIGFSLRS